MSKIVIVFFFFENNNIILLMFLIIFEGRRTYESALKTFGQQMSKVQEDSQKSFLAPARVNESKNGYGNENTRSRG